MSRCYRRKYFHFKCMCLIYFKEGNTLPILRRCIESSAQVMWGCVRSCDVTALCLILIHRLPILNLLFIA